MAAASYRIENFKGAYHFLSNFYPESFEWNGRTYPSSEHAYQAAKATLPAHHDWVASAPTPALAKRAGRIIPCRKDWEQVKVKTMASILRAKFAPGTECAALLDATGTAQLVEGNTWGDQFWGVCRGTGQNFLGRILMKIREENHAIVAGAGPA